MIYVVKSCKQKFAADDKSRRNFQMNFCQCLNIGVAPITQLTHVRYKNSNIQIWHILKYARYSESNVPRNLCAISGYFELSVVELLRFCSITTSKKGNKAYKIALRQIMIFFKYDHVQIITFKG